MWILSATSDDQAVSFRLMPGAVMTIGRAEGADLIVDAPLVSRVHCRLEASATAVDVVDLSSTNGTFVNDERVERARLTTGDRLRVGRVELTIERAH
jgi:pSer/pThr/pTyr-binding forkhead associated (FHA) protein